MMQKAVSRLVVVVEVVCKDGRPAGACLDLTEIGRKVFFMAKKTSFTCEVVVHSVPMIVDANSGARTYIGQFLHLCFIFFKFVYVNCQESNQPIKQNFQINIFDYEGHNP